MHGAWESGSGEGRSASLWMLSTVHLHASAQPVAAIVHIAGAQKLGVLCDGSLLLLDYESLEEATLPGIKVLRSCQTWLLLIESYGTGFNATVMWKNGDGRGRQQ